jgi:DNA-binding XRE family transcriptional regulator
MYTISSTQIKAARAMLDWSQYDLASATGLSNTTIGNLESGQMSPRGTTANVIRRTLEQAGLEFIDLEGVRLRRTDIVVYEGQRSCDQLFDDMRHTIRERGGEVVALFRSPQEIAKFCGKGADSNFERLKELSESVALKYILSDSFEPPEQIAAMQFRVAPRQNLGTSSYIAYGNKCAIIAMNNNTGRFKFVVFSMIDFVQEHHGNFYSLWNNAQPLITKT